MKKIFLSGLLAILLIPFVPLIDWVSYRDKSFFIPPVGHTGQILIRNDVYGDGHFGAKRRGRRLHKGIDIYAPLEAEVIASKGGIAKTGFVKNGMGNYVIINHSGNYATLYGHLSKCSVKNKQRVRQGDVIGYVGKTGNAHYKNIKPHVHFEVRKNGERIDPLSVLTEPSTVISR